MSVWRASSEKLIVSGNAGGKNGCFNSEAMQVLKGMEVTLIPNLGATEQWKEKSALLSGICKRVVVANILECTFDEEQRNQDWTLQTSSCIHHQRSRYSTR